MLFAWQKRKQKKEQLLPPSARPRDFLASDTLCIQLNVTTNTASQWHALYLAVAVANASRPVTSIRATCGALLCGARIQFYNYNAACPVDTTRSCEIKTKYLPESDDKKGVYSLWGQAVCDGLVGLFQCHHWSMSLTFVWAPHRRPWGRSRPDQGEAEEIVSTHFCA